MQGPTRRSIRLFFQPENALIQYACSVDFALATITYVFNDTQPYSKPSPTPRKPHPPPTEEFLVKVTEYPVVKVFHPLSVPKTSFPPLYWDAPYARGAWIVPVNGPAIDPIASSGKLMNSSTLGQNLRSPESPSSLDAPTTIQWTLQGVKAFWLILRKIRRDHQIGPLGVHFESSDDCDSHELLSMPGAPSRNHAAKEVEASSSNRPLRRTPPPQRREWFKVHCEGIYALRVRMLLSHIKTPELPTMASGVPGPSPASSVNRKILDGARLLYVDELGKPLLLA